MTKPSRILIVEDEIFTTLYLEMEFRQEGFEIVGTAVTGEEAVEIARTCRPDIVLMDVQLAGAMSGIEAARQIRSLDTMPILFVSGYEDEDVREQAAGMPRTGYLVKPVIIRRLKDAIASLLAG